MYAKLTLSAAFVALAFSHNALAADHNLSADHIFRFIPCLDSA